MIKHTREKPLLLVQTLFGISLWFATPASASTAYAKTLIDAALNRKDLTHH
jgi:hypothetical protein